jgi:hypothetical protein
MTDKEIEALICLATDSKSDSDYSAVFKALKGKEVYVNVSTSDSGSMSVPLALVGQNLKAAIFYTDRGDSRLQKNFGGMPWEKALEMVIKMPNADGLVIQGNTSAWIALEKQKVAELLKA